LRPWTSLNHNWYNSYDTKRNKSQKQKKHKLCFFLQYCKKTEMEIFAIWALTLKPIKIWIS
jgi:hypothetical protein